MALTIATSRKAAARPATRSRCTTVKVAAFRVTLQMPQGKSKVMEVGPDESIMDGVDANNIELPYLCRTGTCGTCAGRVISGRVEQIGQHILEPHQVAAGFALMCSSYPRSDVTILTHQEENCLTLPYATTTKH